MDIYIVCIIVLISLYVWLLISERLINRVKTYFMSLEIEDSYRLPNIIIYICCFFLLIFTIGLIIFVGLDNSNNLKLNFWGPQYILIMIEILAGLLSVTFSFEKSSHKYKFVLLSFISFLQYFVNFYFIYSISLAINIISMFFTLKNTISYYSSNKIDDRNCGDIILIMLICFCQFYFLNYTIFKFL